MKRYDKKYHFKSMFNGNTGFFIRGNVLKEENGKLVETDEEPFMASYPELIDIGVMGRCVCAGKCNVDCYQKAENTGKDMSLDDFTWIIEQSKGLLYEVALGGKGDVDTHANFKEILEVCAENYIVPNFTTSGIALTDRSVDLCKEYCGAVAVSEHFSDYTKRAVQMLLKKGVKTNIHYVLSTKTIDYAIKILKNEVDYFKGINAVVFLLYKPVGYGREEFVLQPTDNKLREFFEAFDNRKAGFKIGFDSCSAPGLLNYASVYDKEFVDYCEGGRFSMYIGPDMYAMPCSFANQDTSWQYKLDKNTGQDILSAWNSELFEKFRGSLRNRCAGCKDRLSCGGGCPLLSSIVLCDRAERTF